MMQEYKNLADEVEIVYLLQSFENAVNIGHMFRIADAVGAKELVITGDTYLPYGEFPANIEELDVKNIEKKFSRDVLITSMGQENRVPYRYYNRPDFAVKKLKEEGFRIISVEITENAICYKNFKYPNKVCLVLGNETKGVFSSVLSLSDDVVYIPMFGKNYSLNVHVSGALVGYEVRYNQKKYHVY